MKWRRYDDIALGQSFPDSPARFEVTADVIEDYAALSRDAVVDGAESPFGSEEVSPTLAAVFIRPAQNALNGPPGGVHAKQRFQFHHPVRRGDILLTSLVAREKYERKGRRYLVSETTTVNQDQVVVTTGFITQIWGHEA